MGSQNSKFLSEQQLPQEYRPLKQQPGIYQNILNGARLQKHKIQLNSEAEIKYEKQIFVFRRMHSERLISASFFEKMEPGHFCNMSYEVTFFTQHPSYVLSLDLSIPTDKAFYLLIETLQGFQILFHKFGAFSIGFHNVFFNVHHEPRVWISSDLGRTRVEGYRCLEMNEQRMIIDVFRLYDQLKDERNSYISFSNYLKKLKQKQGQNLTFKRVIAYLVDEASRYFQRRTKSNTNNIMKIENYKIQNRPHTKNESNAVKKSSKQKIVSNTISLKSKSKMISKYASTNESSSPFGAKFNQSGQTSFKQDNNQIDKKPKRHNSQEDSLLNNREINYYKRNLQKGLQETVWLQNNRPTHYRLGQSHQTQQNRINPQDPNTIRVFRKSLDEGTKHGKINHNFQHLVRRTVLRQVNTNIKTTQTKKHHNNMVEAQIPRQDFININQIKLPKRHMGQNSMKQVLFEDPNKKMQTAGPLANGRIIIQEVTEENLALSNLRTLKSIINSDYSDMDSQIRADLESMNF